LFKINERFIIPYCWSFKKRNFAKEIFKNGFIKELDIITERDFLLHHLSLYITTNQVVVTEKIVKSSFAIWFATFLEFDLTKNSWNEVKQFYLKLFLRKKSRNLCNFPWIWFLGKIREIKLDNFTWNCFHGKNREIDSCNFLCNLTFLEFDFTEKIVK